jgi:hypothetical protein
MHILLVSTIMLKLYTSGMPLYELIRQFNILAHMICEIDPTADVSRHIARVLDTAELMTPANLQQELHDVLATLDSDTVRRFCKKVQSGKCIYPRLCMCVLCFHANTDVYGALGTWSI